MGGITLVLFRCIFNFLELQAIDSSLHGYIVGVHLRVVLSVELTMKRIYRWECVQTSKGGLDVRPTN
jgi:hypothetical protein